MQNFGMTNRIFSAMPIEIKCRKMSTLLGESVENINQKEEATLPSKTMQLLFPWG